MADALSLDQQTAIVTGGSSGIGFACALQLARAGANIVATYHSDEDCADELVERIEADGGSATSLMADVSDVGDVANIIACAIDTFGGVDILINNAGTQKDAPLTEMTADDWRRVIDVNLTGQFFCAQAAVKEFLRRGRRPQVSRSTGKIVFISSIHQFIPWAGHANYAASKGGIDLLMQTIAQEMAVDRIRVNAVAPGAIRTSINEDVWSDTQKEKEVLKLIPYGRWGDPEDVANAVHWLVSDLSDYVTGETLVVGGGMRLYPCFIGNG